MRQTPAARGTCGIRRFAVGVLAALAAATPAGATETEHLNAQPWKLLTADTQPLGAGARIVMTVEQNFTAEMLGRITMKDIFKPGVPIDRVFTFQGPTCWGFATLEKAGRVKPRPVRLADGREFAVTMVDGLPVLEPGRELHLESLCVAGPVAAVVPP